jgi:hypothetical protein
MVPLQAFVEKEGRLPDSVQELADWVVESGKERYPLGSLMSRGMRVDLRDWVHYRRETSGATVVFLCREEVLSGFDGTERCSEPERPREGDVYFRINASGVVIGDSSGRKAGAS